MEKLKSVSQNLFLATKNRLWRFLKPSLFALSLGLVFLSDFSWFWALIFLFVAVWLYIPSFSRESPTRYAFLILLWSALWSLGAAAESILLSLLSIVLSASAFYVLTGIREHLFIKRSRLYFLCFLFLLYLVFLRFFITNTENFLPLYAGVVLATFLLFREWLAIIPSFHFPRREKVAALVSALILSQLLWTVALLPIGFLSASNLMILCAFLLGDLLFKHFMGSDLKKTLFQELVFFVLLVALIFGTSVWGIGE